MKRNNVKVTVYSAVTILNAIYFEFGAAIGTKIPTTVSVRTHDALQIQVSPPTVDTTLVEACLHRFFTMFPHLPKNIQVRTQSPLPPERGLKTSSAVASALIIALTKHYHIPLTLKDALVLGAQASMEANVSVTGALDDAVACTCGGLNITQNRTYEILLQRQNPFLDLECLLLIPQKKRPKITFTEELRSQVSQQLLTKALKEILKNNVILAIQLNTEAYSELFPETRDIVKDLTTDAAIKAIGLNGGGPSLFAVCNQLDTKNLIKKLEREYSDFQIIRTTFSELRGDLHALIN